MEDRVVVYPRNQRDKALGYLLRAHERLAPLATRDGKARWRAISERFEKEIAALK